MTSYLLDANVFIQAKNAHYGFDIVPAFWEWLEAGHADAKVFTIERVGDEMIPAGDDLSDWMKTTMPKSFRLAATTADQASLGALAAWVTTGNRYTQAAQSDFLAIADYYLVAQAMTLGYTVVTHEISEPNRKNRVKIPDACRQFSVPCISPFKMLSAEKVRFGLA